MKAVTVRQNGALICFGPDNGMYDPSTATPGQRAVEPDYDAVLAEWAAMPKPADPRAVFKSALKNAKSLPDIIAALEGLL